MKQYPVCPEAGSVEEGVGCQFLGHRNSVKVFRADGNASLFKE